jgi:hypothetical protein
MAPSAQSNAAALDARLADLESDLAHFAEDRDDEHSALAADLRARQEALRAEVRAAIDRDDVWATIGADLTRDFDALAGEAAKLILRGGEGRGAGPQTGADDARA